MHNFKNTKMLERGDEEDNITDENVSLDEEAIRHTPATKQHRLSFLKYAIIIIITTLLVGFYFIPSSELKVLGVLPQEIPDNVRKCWNPESSNKIDYYLVAVSMMKNKRRYVREWIEFHLMMGISYFIIYDNYSDDGLEMVLKPYVDAGRVSYVLWPPKNYPSEEWDDPLLEKHFKGNMDKCYANREAEHIHVPCQIAAYDEAIRRTRGKVRWMTGIDVDEFYYIPENSTIWQSHPNNPLVGAFEHLEKYNLVTVSGQHFGTSGWYSPPRRDSDQTHAQLITKTHLHHMQYVAGELVKASEHIKPFINPYCVFGNELHSYQYDSSVIKNISWKYTFHNTYDDDNATVLMNHYLWPSYIENIQKAIANGNPKTGYDSSYDRFINKEEGSTIEYLLDRLEERMQLAIKTKPPLDNHADDWDYTLKSKHVYDPSIKLNLCVVLLDPSHIGLARHSLLSIINYFYRVESTLSYKLIVHNANQNIKGELENDFPIDVFINKEQDVNSFCSADYILRIKESSFARWEVWPLEKRAVELGIQLLTENEGVNGLSLSDSSNLLADWVKGSNINYRSNSELSNKSETLLIKKNAMTDKNIYEMCLHTEDLCPDNRIRSVFESFQQERMYGFKPLFLKR